MDNKTVLHLGSDSHNYDYVVSSLNRLGVKNQYYLVDVGEDRLTPKKIKSKQIIGFKPNSIQFRAFVEELPSLQKVIIHYYTAAWAKFILTLPPSVEVTWVFWGNDGYLLPKMRSSIHSAKTKELLQPSSSHPITRKLKKLKRWLTREKTDRQYLELGLPRINTCATWVENDWLKIKKAYTINPQYCYFAYYSIDMLIDTNLRKKENAKSILVGHSGDPANNHLDAFDYIIKNKLEYDRIVCPMTYGFRPDYGNTVLQKGQELFGDQFYPLLTHLPIEEYNELLTSVHIGLALHNYQKGAGNTLSLLWTGAKVIMRESNTLYQTYKSWGIDVFLEEEVDQMYQPNCFKNQEILGTQMSQSKIDAGYLSLVQ
ncbi:TDP-N-acetylfucosamine:lipid II N-acetylfucosaminyltransferase [Reichenbachiella sp. MSK19-1]|uniref:TDP-N-acetylfucosamine:lipid II N-acetylfucosaminyltransferase n=1 Tax=Reichenbachiella sp. MSK19-1 TaxID=1897631 RepID=UPI000E6B9769|nr:TDP-N-acetylfucosamine:lipid II N-acetylfucosaminyltransferase [Reichenbachiella sp. MSK19-1]RJE70857.1 hypothetical protein BGP76_08725 [Reichenbachiella sp. MSK19-1]